jgi:hypothetical protein
MDEYLLDNEFYAANWDSLKVEYLKHCKKYEINGRL